MSEKLKECPFCGGECVLDEEEHCYEMMYSACCSGCHFHGTWTTADKAITAWNTRTPDRYASGAREMRERAAGLLEALYDARKSEAWNRALVAGVTTIRALPLEVE